MRRIDSRDWIEVAPDIDTDWSDRRRVTQTYSDSVAVVVNEVIRVDRIVDVPAVIEDHPSKRFHDAQREAQL